jgi:hypothetical protein
MPLNPAAAARPGGALGECTAAPLSGPSARLRYGLRGDGNGALRAASSPAGSRTPQARSAGPAYRAPGRSCGCGPGAGPAGGRVGSANP